MPVIPPQGKVKYLLKWLPLPPAAVLDRFLLPFHLGGNLWATVTPLSKECMWTVMESSCHGAAQCMLFHTSRIPHSVAVMVLTLAFYTEYPNKVGNTIDTFLFTDIFPLAWSEVALLTRLWDISLG